MNVQCMYIQNEIAIHMYVYCIEKSVNISITRITRVTMYAFVMLLLAMISADFQVDGYHGC